VAGYEFEDLVDGYAFESLDNFLFARRNAIMRGSNS
jgi:hypothetical protein